MNYMNSSSLELSLSTTSVKVLNMIATLFAIIFNTFAVILPLNNRSTREISDSLANYFTPAPYVFSIWSIIYIGWILFALYPFLKEAEGFTHKVNLWYFTNLFANGIWIVLWHYGEYLLSVFVMIYLLFSLIVLYQRLEIGSMDNSTENIIFKKFPVSIYFGWITVATIANMVAYLVSINVTFNDLDPIITVLVIAVGFIIGFLVVIRNTDYLYSLVFIWAYLGVFVAQSGNQDLVANSALLFLLLFVVTDLYMIYKSRS